MCHIYQLLFVCLYVYLFVCIVDLRICMKPTDIVFPAAVRNIFSNPNGLPLETNIITQTYGNNCPIGKQAIFIKLYLYSCT